MESGSLVTNMVSDRISGVAARLNWQVDGHDKTELVDDQIDVREGCKETDRSF